MAKLDFSDKIERATSRITSMEQMSGKGLLQPFTNTNAGARKIMHGTHRDHIFPLMNGEKAIIETGYEIRFGDYSSSITAADSDYRVIAKISKYSFSPNHHYYLIVQDMKSNCLDVLERISYHHITESYGYLYNNEYLDSLQIGSIIPQDTIVQKSLAFDQYCNRRDGINVNLTYMALDDNMEDSIIMSESAAKKLTAPLIKPVTITINENDIPLDLRGRDGMYKSFPDIGEEIDGAILLALRKEKKDESLYMQSVQRLRELMLPDDKYTLHGRVIDVNIYCNNPENLNGLYNGQFKMYYNELQRTCAEIVSTLMQYVSNGYKMTYELQELYGNAKRVMNRDQYNGKRQFSNIVLEIVVLEEKRLEAGDKISNRYGGKGVTSKILPDEMMPMFGPDNKRIEVILNSSTMYNRENPGQLFELSLTYIGTQLLEHIKKNNFTVDAAIQYIVKYVTMVSKLNGDKLKEFLYSLSNEERCIYLENMIRDDAIDLSIKPSSESMSIEKLEALYDAFPFIEQTEIRVPMVGSTGQIRYVPARRKMVVSKQYIFRLKQFSEEKFSATNLSATNIRNENAKSRAAKDYKDLYSNTPIRFGNMESNDLNHIGSEHVVTNLLIHSLSPHGRRLVEQMYTEEPFQVDIKLDSDSTNRMAEIVSTYLKTIGKVIKFIKVKKNIKPAIVKCPIVSLKPRTKSPIYYNKEKDFDFEEDFKKRQEFAKHKEETKDQSKGSPIYYQPRRWDSPFRKKGNETYGNKEDSSI